MDATLLACSFDQVATRVRDRGKHLAPYSLFPDTAAIATAAWTAEYSETYDPSVLGISREELTDTLGRNGIIWAPDGDEAFDDGSQVLQFDIGDQVRIIGSRWTGDGQTEPSDLRDLSLPADQFYGTLERWRALFEKEWASTPKRSS